MKDLIEYIIKAIVQKPDQVQVKEIPGEGFISLEITADENDYGQIIGKNGKIIKALQILVQAKGRQHGERCFLKITDSKREGIVSSSSG